MSNQESPPYSERSILVLGGAGRNSIGLAAVEKFHELGSRAIYVGTTQQEHFDDIKSDFEKRGLTTDNLHPFVADVRDKSSLLVAAREIKDLRLGLTDVVFAHAGGMEGFLPQLLNKYLIPIRVKMKGSSSLNKLSNEVQTEVRAMMAPMYEQIKIWREEAIPHGIAVNYQGTFNAIEILGEEFPSDKRGVFTNSMWGYASGTTNPETGEPVQIPLLYGPVDIPKAMLRQRLIDEADLLFRGGFPIGEEIATLVRGTRVGKTFQDFLMPLSSPQQASEIRRTAIDVADAVGGIRMIIEGDPNTWPNHHWDLFVSSEDGTAVYGDHIDLSSAMYQIPYPY